jgi:hypothetical protein
VVYFIDYIIGPVGSWGPCMAEGTSDTCRVMGRHASCITPGNKRFSYVDAQTDQAGVSNRSIMYCWGRKQLELKRQVLGYRVGRRYKYVLETKSPVAVCGVCGTCVDVNPGPVWCQERGFDFCYVFVTKVKCGATLRCALLVGVSREP